MKKQIQYNVEAAKYTSAEDILKRLNALRTVLDNKTYTVAFMGQFSAGKSMLINNILGMDILPVHITETTPIITNIRYGNSVGARINYIDETSKSIAIEAVKDIWQSSELSSELNLKDIATVDVFLDNALLQSGMIIADTPGINTIISQHEAIAERLLSYVEEIFFVTSKTLTAEDLKFLDLIIHLGMKVSVVRTHMDAVNAHEESPLEIEADETKKNINFIGDGVKTYFVSNLHNSKYFANIDKIREHISINLANNLYSHLKSSCSKRLEKLQESLVIAVKDKLQELEAKENGEKLSLEDKQEKLIKAQNKLHSLLDKQTMYVEKNMSYIENSASEKLNQQVNVIISSLQDKFSAIEYSESCNEEYENKANKILYDSIAYLRESYFHDFNDLLVEINKKIDLDISLNKILNQEGIPEINNIDDLILLKQQEDNQLEVLEDELEQKKLSVEKMLNKGNDSDNYARQIEDLQAEIDDIKLQRQELGSYQPQYITIPANNTWSTTLSNAGNVLDLATLFIPATTPSKANIVAKVGNVVSKVAKGEDVVKIVKSLNKTRKAIGRAKDIKKAGKAILRGAINAKKAGLFDIISLEYWGGKLGECFDEPEHQVIDENHRQQFFVEQRNLERSAREKVVNLMSLKRKTGKYESEMEAREDEIKLLQQEMSKITKKLEKRRLILEKEAQRDFLKKLSNDWVKWTKNKIYSLAEQIKANSAPLISKAMTDYADIKLKAYSIKLDELKAQKEIVFNELSVMSDNELHQEIIKGKDILKKLEIRNG